MRLRKDVYEVDFEMSLKDFLNKKCLFFRRVSMVDFLSKKQILIDNLPADSLDIVLFPKSQVTIVTPESFEPVVDSTVVIVYEDDFLLVINKPAPLPVHPAGIYYFHTLVKVLEDRGFGSLHLVHRLDKETSGVLILAKSIEVAQQLTKQFTKRLVQKEYVAIVAGSLPALVGMIDAPLDKVEYCGIRDYMVCSSKGQTAQTGYEVVDEKGGVSLVILRPETGRRHQLRAHMVSVHAPIVGDKQYGVDPSVFISYVQGGVVDVSGVFGASRQLLHAYKISFTHPVLKRSMAFCAPIPRDMVSFNPDLDFSFIQ